MPAGQEQGAVVELDRQQVAFAEFRFREQAVADLLRARASASLPSPTACSAIAIQRARVVGPQPAGSRRVEHGESGRWRSSARIAQRSIVLDQVRRCACAFALHRSRPEQAPGDAAVAVGEQSGSGWGCRRGRRSPAHHADIARLRQVDHAEAGAAPGGGCDRNSMSARPSGRAMQQRPNADSSTSKPTALPPATAMRFPMDIDRRAASAGRVFRARRLQLQSW